MKELNFHELNKNNLTCAHRRKGLVMEAAKKDMQNFQKSIPIYRIINKMLEMDKVQSFDWYRNDVTDGFKEVNFPTEETKNEHVCEMAVLLERYHKYIISLKLDPEIDLPKLDFCPSEDIKINGVSPNFIYITGKEIHVVKISQGKPTFSKKAAEYRSDLYALAQYGRFLIPSGRTATVVAEYHFLRSSKDKSDHILEEYDDGGSNIIAYSNEYSNPQKDFTAWDIKMLSHLMMDGAECSEEDCEKCEQRRLCHYKHAPLGSEVPMAVKALSELNLSEDQENAIQYGDGILKINAGPGAGKTVVVCARTASLLASGVKPHEILLITFTESGAKEMRDRIKLYTDDFGIDVDFSQLRILTFNAFGQQIIDSEWSNLGFTRKPSLIDDVERYAILAKLLNEHTIPDIDYRNFKMKMPLMGALEITKKVFEIIKSYNLSYNDKDLLILKEKLDRDICNLSERSFKPLFDLYDEYYKKLREECLIEYADQENLIFEVLRMDPYYLEDTEIAHIIIDEFQDTSQKQMDFIKNMMDSKYFRSLMVVGDDSQSIYSFRDTTPEFMIHFFDYIGRPGDEIGLLENHRSTPEIVNFANAINDLNIEKVDKKIIPDRPSNGKAVKVESFWETFEEYDFIVDEIKKRIDEGVKPEDIAFIAASKNELLVMSSLLADEGIPTILLNPERLLDNSRVLAAIALAKWLTEPSATQEAVTYANVLTKGTLMDKTDEQINSYVSSMTQQTTFENLKGQKKRDYFHELLEELDEDDEIYEAFVESLKGKVNLSKELEYCKQFEEYGDGVAIRRKKIYSGVVLTTAHSSKGLEWPVVFASISKYYPKYVHSPFNRKRATAMVEEKRRLLFVAATRARDELIITGKFVSFGSAKEGYVYNRFLRESTECIGEKFEPVMPSAEEKKAKKEEHERRLERNKAKKAAAAAAVALAKAS